MKVFILLFISLMSLYGASLLKSGKYVIDKKNKLMWQDTKSNINDLVSHYDAPKYCEKVTMGGFTNWRVPSVEEYKTIIDKTRKDEIMINRAFTFILPDDYWAADNTWRNFGKWGYYIFFKSGTAYYENRTYKKLIRCVRTMQ